MWKVLVEPIAGVRDPGPRQAMPEEMKQLAGPLMAMLGRASGAMVASQVGSGIGALAGDVLSASDIACRSPRSARRRCCPTNVAAFAAELPDVTTDDVLLYLALREAAHQRLFAGVPWLRDHLIGAVSDYGAGMDFDTSGMEAKLREVDIANPQAMQDALAAGCSTPSRRPRRKAALEKLEVTLALVEAGSTRSSARPPPSACPRPAKLQETVRRRRAAGGPAEQTFATLVGLELRPRRPARRLHPVGLAAHPARASRPATACGCRPTCCPPPPTSTTRWASARTRWPPETLSEEEFDAGLRDLLDGGGTDSRERRVSAGLHASAVQTLTGWAAPTPQQDALRRRYLEHHRRPPRRPVQAVLPDHLTAGAVVVSPAADAVLLNHHRKAGAWLAFGATTRRATRRWPTAPAASWSRSPGSRASNFDPEPLSLDEHAVEFCSERGTVHHLDVRFVAVAEPDAPHATSEESLDVRWWPVDALPETFDDMYVLVATAVARVRERQAGQVGS